MKITLNEKPLKVPKGTKVASLIAEHKPGADVIVRNGFPCKEETVLHDGDQIVLFKRGERPCDDELWALMCARHTPGVANKLKKATVGVAGLGGLGSNIAIALARVGVGHLVLIDYDVVEPTNINRQQYFLAQLGLPKTEAIKQTIEAITPFTKITLHTLKLTEENIVELFSECDVVTEAFDGADQKVMLIETLQSEKPELPIVAASGMAGLAPANLIETKKMGNLYICGDFTSEAKPSHGLMAPRVGVCAHHQANQIVRLLLGME